MAGRTADLGAAGVRLRLRGRDRRVRGGNRGDGRGWEQSFFGEPLFLGPPLAIAAFVGYRYGPRLVAAPALAPPPTRLPTPAPTRPRLRPRLRLRSDRPPVRGS
nr:hypothetical protein GCM10020093_057150 [Planobispora longispora]